MGLIILETALNEGGSGTIKVALTDSAGADVTPITATWSFRQLTKVDNVLTKGEVVNELEDKDPTGALGPILYIVLSLDDLAILDGDHEESRALTIKGTYNTTINEVAFPSHPFVLEGIVQIKNLFGIE